MYEFTKPNFLNYLSLETKSTNKSYQKIWFYLNLEGDTTFKIGRGHDCDIRLNDNSISRFHTSLSFINKTFLLKDNNSKFGTLVNIQNSLTVIENIMCPIQIGRTIIKFTLQKAWSFFSCVSSKRKSSIDYQLMNKDGIYVGKGFVVKTIDTNENNSSSEEIKETEKKSDKKDIITQSKISVNEDVIKEYLDDDDEIKPLKSSIINLTYDIEKKNVNHIIIENDLYIKNSHNK